MKNQSHTQYKYMLVFCYEYALKTLNFNSNKNNDLKLRNISIFFIIV